MNIFVLDENPRVAAELQCDKHVVKMATEYMQMLCTAHRVIDGDEYTDRTPKGRRIKRWRHFSDRKEQVLYKATHVNHPSNVWLRESTQHYNWFYQLWYWTAQEYQKRYGKEHATVHIAQQGVLSAPPTNCYDRGWVDPPQAMPVEYHNEDVVEAYKTFYRESKSRFAVWKDGTPDFMVTKQAA